MYPSSEPRCTAADSNDEEDEEKQLVHLLTNRMLLVSSARSENRLTYFPHGEGSSQNAIFFAAKQTFFEELNDFTTFVFYEFFLNLENITIIVKKRLFNSIWKSDFFIDIFIERTRFIY